MKETKNFNVRLPKDLWVFLKKHAIKDQTSLNKILIDLVQKFKEKKSKKSVDIE